MEAYAALADGSTDVGNELWNSARLAQYLAAGYGPPGVDVNACTFCDGLQNALTCVDPNTGDTTPQVYTYPSDPANPAPWYDEADPSSGDFAGLLILGITGWETSQVSRPVTDRVGDGAVLGRKRRLARELVVEALLIGRTCCSLQSGLRWLTSVLDAPCGPCIGQELDYFECCPGSGAGFGCATGPTPAESEDRTKASFDQHRRSLRNVGLTDGVRVTEKIGRACGRCASGCSYMKVEFTLTAGDPFSYSDPVVYAEDQLLASGDFTRCVNFSSNCTDLCGTGTCPTGDPNCPVADPPPSLPVIQSCTCVPLQSTGGCVTVTPAQVPDWQELVPIININAGASPLRHIEVVIYQNPLGLPAADLDDCDACGAFTIGYLQAGSTFTIDGRDRRFRVSCGAGAPSNGSRLVSGSDGRPFMWPVLGCDSGYTICVTADSTSAAADASFDVSLVARSLA